MGFPRLALNQGCCVSPYCSVCGAQKAIVWIPHLNEKGWPGSRVALLGCRVLCARAQGTLVPMPSLRSFRADPPASAAVAGPELPRRGAGLGGRVGLGFVLFRS